jgi:hypothetical protein
MAMNDRMRASDADRERITARLREHFAEGRLTREELDERVAAVLNAKTLGDLRVLMTDLPEPEPVLPQAAGLQPMAGPVVFARRGPRLLPLLMLLAFLAILAPGGGLVLLAALQFVLVFALLAGAVALLAAARFRRRMRRHWVRGNHPTWGYPR